MTTHYGHNDNSSGKKTGTARGIRNNKTTNKKKRNGIEEQGQK